MEEESLIHFLLGDDIEELTISDESTLSPQSSKLSKTKNKKCNRKKQPKTKFKSSSSSDYELEETSNELIELILRRPFQLNTVSESSRKDHTQDDAIRLEDSHKSKIKSRSRNNIKSKNALEGHVVEGSSIISHFSTDGEFKFSFDSHQGLNEKGAISGNSQRLSQRKAEDEKLGTHNREYILELQQKYIGKSTTFDNDRINFENFDRPKGRKTKRENKNLKKKDAQNEKSSIRQRQDLSKVSDVSTSAKKLTQTSAKKHGNSKIPRENTDGKRKSSRQHSQKNLRGPANNVDEGIKKSGKIPTIKAEETGVHPELSKVDRKSKRKNKGVVKGS